MQFTEDYMSCEILTYTISNFEQSGYYTNNINDKLIGALESQIKEQQSEIAYLRKLLEKELLGKYFWSGLFVPMFRVSTSM